MGGWKGGKGGVWRVARACVAAAVAAAAAAAAALRCGRVRVSWGKGGGDGRMDCLGLSGTWYFFGGQSTQAKARGPELLFTFLPPSMNASTIKLDPIVAHLTGTAGLSSMVDCAPAAGRRDKQEPMVGLCPDGGVVSPSRAGRVESGNRSRTDRRGVSEERPRATGSAASWWA